MLKRKFLVSLVAMIALAAGSLSYAGQYGKTTKQNDIVDTAISAGSFSTLVTALQAAGLVDLPPPCDTAPLVTQILEAAGDRLKIAGDILNYDDFFRADEALDYDEKAFEKRISKPEEAIGLLKQFREQLATTESFDAASLESLLKEWVEAKQIKIGQVIHALRVAVTGKAAGFGMFETLAILGKEKCLTRIDWACQRAAQNAS